MTDNITLPREVGEHLTKMLEECPLIPNQDWSERDCAALTALRTALAAEQPKPEPVAWMDRFGFVFRGKGPHETFTTPLYTAPPALAAEQPVPTDKDSLTVQSRLDAESFREERDEARALLNGVLQDIEALRRDAELGRWIREETPPIEEIAARVDAMEDKT